MKYAGRFLMILLFIAGTTAGAYEFDKRLRMKDDIRAIARGTLMLDVWDKIGAPDKAYEYPEDNAKFSYLYQTWMGDCRVYFHRARLISTKCASPGVSL